MAFSAHFVVAADVDPDWVRGQLPPGDWTAPHGARFLVALADRIGVDIGAMDVVLAAGRGAGRRSLSSRRSRPGTTRGWCARCATARTCGSGGPRPARARAGRPRPGRPVGDGLRGRAGGARHRSRAVGSRPQLAGLVPAGQLTGPRSRPGHRRVAASRAGGRLPPGLRRSAHATGSLSVCPVRTGRA